MLAKVCSAAVNGIEAYPVEVEVNAGWGGDGDRDCWASRRRDERIAGPGEYCPHQFRVQVSSGPHHSAVLVGPEQLPLPRQVAEFDIVNNEACARFSTVKNLSNA